jgi:hypothetical protein
MNERREMMPKGEEKRDFAVSREVESQIPLVLKYREIRENLDSRAEELGSHMRIYRGEGVRIGLEPVSIEELETADKELADEGLDTGSYLIKSSGVLENSGDIRRGLVNDSASDLVDLVGGNDRIEEIDRMLESINNKMRIGRGLKIFNKRALARERASLGEKLEKLEVEYNAKTEAANKLEAREWEIKHKRDDLLIDEALGDIKEIRDVYSGFWQEVLEEGSVADEIREEFLKNVIYPMEMEARPEEREKYSKALRNYFAYEGTSNEERERSRKEVGSVAWDAARHIVIDGGDKKIISRFVGRLAAWEINKIVNLVRESDMISSGLKPRFLEAYLKMELRSEGEGRDGFGDVLIGELNDMEAGAKGYPNMDLWEAFRNSETGNAIFGDKIKAEDERIYNRALEESLWDTGGRDIDALEYYPRPEAIRNLVLLAAADRDSYRTVHSNLVLRSLARREDWGDVLDQTFEVYPDLSGARGLLEGWDYTQDSNAPGIKEAVSKYALSVAGDERASYKLSDLAMRALTNSDLVEVLNKKKLIEDEGASELKKAWEYLENLESESLGNFFTDEEADKYFYTYISLERTLRSNLFDLTTGIKENKESGVQRLIKLSKSVNENKGNMAVLNYLTSSMVVEKVVANDLSDEDIEIFLSAYKDLPGLLKNSGLAVEFCNQFTGGKTVEFFAEMDAAYGDRKEQMVRILGLVRGDLLGKSRALEMPRVAPDVLSSENFSLARDMPALFLQTDDGVGFFMKTDKGDLFSLDRELDQRIGSKIRKLEKERVVAQTVLTAKLAPLAIERVDKELSLDKTVEMTEQNWQELLFAYVRSQADISLRQLSPDATGKVTGLFEDRNVRDFCSTKLRESWKDYLRAGKHDEMPFSLQFMSGFIEYCGGVGPLSQIESLSSLIGATEKNFEKETTVTKTKEDISKGLAAMEDRFDRERWSNEDRTDFYNISKDFLVASPSLFSEYLVLFEQLKPAEMRKFAKEIYPLYRTKLVFLENRTAAGRISHNKLELVAMRKDVGNFGEVFHEGEGAFDSQKQKLFDEIKVLFKDRFGFIQLPEEFTSEHIRSVSDVSTYLANLQYRNSEKEGILGLYLALMMNDKWSDFREGKKVHPREYLVAEKAIAAENFLAKREQLNPLKAEALGIAQEDMPEFMKLLMQETQNIRVGNIETIDVKLTNVLLNVRGLTDPDLYPDPMDKQRMGLLLQWGNKKMGSIAAKMFQSLNTPARVIQFSEEEEQIRRQITSAMEHQGITLSAESLKQHFQDGVRVLAPIVNILNLTEETGVEPEVGRLRELLKPSTDVVGVFGKLGEDFKPTSGAMAVSADLSYLDNLVVSREKELTVEESKLLKQYTSQIREQMVKLEEIHGQIKERFANIKMGTNGVINPLLADRLAEIDRSINAPPIQQAITSVATNNLNTIIENMRECLACARGGANNDTNLTFGDPNKFYIYSQVSERGSISDQIAFLEPVKRADDYEEMAFVLDRVYGTSTPVVLENQIDVVMKKYAAIKQRFPNIKLKVFVTGSAATSGGTSIDLLDEKYREKEVRTEKETVEVNVVESASADHYVEFGGGSRTAGKRQVEGLVLY